MRLSGQKSAEGIVPEPESSGGREGLNVVLSLNLKRLVSNTKKAENSIKRLNLHEEAGVELRGNRGEPSIAPAMSEGKDKDEVDTSKLLEEVLDRKNLSLAYKRVKKNGGSHGVDGVQVDELLSYLLQNGESIRQ